MATTNPASRAPSPRRAWAAVVSAGTVVGLPFGATVGALAGWRFAFGLTAAAAAVAAV
jgi:predicted MFS family arabinose efflux permease